MKTGSLKSVSRPVLACFSSLIFLLAACTPAGRKTQSDYPGKWLEEITVTQLQRGYKEKKFTVKDVVTAYLDRIEAIDRNGPCLNSIICINPEAIIIAEDLDRELMEGKVRGPMHGIPVILKDNIDTRDRMPTTAGATVLRNSFPENDSHVAKKLREAGAVIIAKSNLSEWANFRSSVSSSGWSGIGGQTKNPYVLDRNPCGSSSGSGVAVSANLCAIAIGTETNGSIVCPSNNNGIVGIKPTVGLISRSGIIPISFTQDTPGPMGRTVEDAAICLGVLTGIDTADIKTSYSEGKSRSNYSEYLRSDGLKGKRIGLLKDEMGFSDKVDTLFMNAAKYMTSQGAEIIPVNLPKDRSYEKASWQVMLFEFKNGLNRYFAGLGAEAPVKSLKELIEFNKTDSVELKYFDQKILEMAEKKVDTGSEEYKKALDQMLTGSRKNGIDKLMDDNGLDAIISPTGSPAWKTDLVNGDHFIGGSSSLAAISGYPSITVPLGFIPGLPVGISFTGRAWSEPVLLEIAYSYEQGTRQRKAPAFLETD